MKTGRLLKFQRGGAQVHAYLYNEAGVHQAVVYVSTPDGGSSALPVHHIEGAVEAEVEAQLRTWLDQRYPRDGRRG